MAGADANRLPERPWLVPGIAIGGGDMDVIPGMVGASRLAIRGAGLVSRPHAGKDALERGLTAMDEDDLEPRREAPGHQISPKHRLVLLIHTTLIAFPSRRGRNLPTRHVAPRRARRTDSRRLAGQE